MRNNIERPSKIIYALIDYDGCTDGKSPTQGNISTLETIKKKLSRIIQFLHNRMIHLSVEQKYDTHVVIGVGSNRQDYDTDTFNKSYYKNGSISDLRKAVISAVDDFYRKDRKTTSPCTWIFNDFLLADIYNRLNPGHALNEITIANNPDDPIPLQKNTTPKAIFDDAKITLTWSHLQTLPLILTRSLASKKISFNQEAFDIECHFFDDRDNKPMHAFFTNNPWGLPANTKLFLHRYIDGFFQHAQGQLLPIKGRGLLQRLSADHTNPKTQDYFFKNHFPSLLLCFIQLLFPTIHHNNGIDQLSFSKEMIVKIHRLLWNEARTVISENEANARLQSIINPTQASVQIPSEQKKGGYHTNHPTMFYDPNSSLYERNSKMQISVFFLRAPQRNAAEKDKNANQEPPKLSH